jgi:uncharacterized membrane protein
MKARYALSLLGLAAGTMLSDPSAGAASYWVTDLGTLSDTVNNNTCGAEPTGINNQDQVVGNYAISLGTGNPYFGAHGFLWDNAKLSQLGASYASQFPQLTVTGINNRGHIIANVGEPCVPLIGGAIFRQLFFGDKQTITDLAVKLPAQNWVGARLSGINDNDRIVRTLGYYVLGSPPPLEAFTYNPTNNRLVKLGFPATFTRSYGVAINIHGTVVGNLVTNTGWEQAAWWNGTWHVLTCLPGDSYCTATGINNYNEIIGESESGGFIWDGRMTMLPNPTNISGAVPLAINDGGTTVGYACNNRCVAIVWDEHHRSAVLNDLINQHDPAHGLVNLEWATAINSSGVTVAQGCWTGGANKDQCRPFLLTPNAERNDQVATQEGQ